MVMRIGIASCGLGHVTRGVEAWAEDLWRALRERGESATLFKGGGEERAESEHVVRCWQRDSAKTRLFLRAMPKRGLWRIGLASGYQIEQTTFALNLIPLLRRERIDILHVKDPHVAAVVRKAWKFGLLSTRTILSHGTGESLEYLEKFEYLQHLAPTYFEEARTAGFWKPTWTTVPNFTDTDVFHPGRADHLRDELAIPRDALIVLTAAAIKRNHKRIDYLLEEFRRLLDSVRTLPVWLVVAGGQETETNELVRAGKDSLGDRVRFLIRFPRNRMHELYRAADLFVLCTLQEMFGTVLLEAMASRLPCVVHQHSVPEWVIGSGGLAIDMAATGTLATALKELLRDPEARERFGRAGRERCVTTFGKASIVEQNLAYYRLVLTHDRPVDSAQRENRGSADVT